MDREEVVFTIWMLAMLGIQLTFVWFQVHP